MAEPRFKDHSQGELRWKEKFLQISEPLSLVDAAALQVTRNLTLTEHALKVVPHSLFPVLLAASLDTALVVCTKAIVVAWPHKILSFKTIQNFTKLSRIKSLQQQHDQAALAVAMAISEHSHIGIRDIDITALRFRLSDLTGKQFLETLLKGKEGMNEPKKKKRKSDGTDYPELRVIMRTDIRGKGATEWLKLQSRLKSVNIHVISRTLQASQCGVELLEKVLEEFRTEATVQLDISYNTLENCGLERALQPVHEFKALTSLCICYNNINVRNQNADEAMKTLGLALSRLPALRSLKLTGNRLTGKLGEILRLVQQPLQLLDVSMCMLSGEDIAYLAGSHHATGLRHLYLSENSAVGRHLQEMDRLLRRVSGTLVELDLERTGIRDHKPSDFVKILAKVAPTFTSLKALEIHNNELCAKEQVDLVLAFVRCPQMQELRVSFPSIVMDEPWQTYTKAKLSSRLRPDAETTAAVWFTLTCWKKRSKENPDYLNPSRPLTVYVYDEDCGMDISVFDFPIA